MSDFPIFYSEDQYNEYMADLYAEHRSEMAQAAAELGNDEFQRLYGGADYNYTCERCGGRCNTDSPHTANECFENRVERAADELWNDIVTTYIELDANADAAWAIARASMWYAIAEALYIPSEELPF